MLEFKLGCYIYSLGWCVKWGVREVPFYSLRRSVPTVCIYGKNQGWVGATPPQDAPGRVPVWVRATLGVAKPQMAPPRPSFLWLADRWVLVLSHVCMCLGAPVCSDLWVLLCQWHTWIAIFCAFLRVFTYVCAEIQWWMLADHNSIKLMEFISYKSYI